MLNFEIGLNISPLQDTINIGDTLWLSMAIPEYLTEIISSDDIFVKNFNFNIRCVLNRMDLQETPPAFNEFGFENKLGNFEIFNSGNGGAFAKINTELTDNNQIIQVGIIPTTFGLFQIGFYNLTSDLTCQSLSAFGNDLNNLNISFKMNDGGLEINNYSFLLESPGLIATQEEFTEAGLFIFKVAD